MIYVFVTYNPSFEHDSPESWFKRTEGYTGALFYLAQKHTVINIKQINYEGDCLYRGVHYYFINFGKKKSLFPKKLNRLVKSFSPDIVFLQGLHKPFQFIQLGVRLSKKTRVIAQHHAEKPLTGFKKILQRIADKYIDAYLFASHSMGVDWVKKGNISSSDKIHEVMEVSSIFSPMNKAEAKQKTGVPDGIIFLWVGRLNDNKDPLTVLSAFLKFAEVAQGAHLYMVYHTEELLNEIKELLNNSVQKQAVTLIGKVPHDELQYWFNSADIILSGSHYEGSGTAVCEAMSCGCMPIVTDIDSFRMITNNGKCGFLYEAGNEAALLSTLHQIDKIDLAEKQKASLEYFRSKLSFEAIAKRIQEIAESL
ncbi:MAG TPA: glycosyltransferase family 4 protein [Mucilaginibacter sp.]|jgi:glycosyltransferase involved in cell wall biosynthesis|nr:glycosyltransferase family 4 protein [Mucilaginibacter sp.]